MKAKQTKDIIEKNSNNNQINATRKVRMTNILYRSLTYPSTRFQRFVIEG